MDKEVLAKMWNAAIPKLEPKQETLEEAAFESSVDYKPFEDDLKPQAYYEYGFIKGAKWQQERMYSEEEVLELLEKALTHKDNGETGNLVTIQGDIRTANFYSWFEQFKNK